MRALIGTLTGLIVAAVTTVAEPAGMRDPTAPYSAAADTPPDTPSGPRLQSTFLAPGGERRAVIDGRTYRLGDTLAGATLSEIRPYEVVLRTASGQERVLRMVPRLSRPMRLGSAPQAAVQEAGRGDGPGGGGTP